MAVAVGTRVGPYEVLGEIGAGGMGQVYRARDRKLGRDVALKTLPPGFSDDPERLLRFEREARILASLNHPHIAAIYGFEEAGSVRALVLELVAGPTLADRIAHGPLPADEAMTIARQIADALEAAHEKGIVHRDLKPANIKLTPAGTVKVLDFGIAKALDPSGEPESSDAPTVTMHGTRRGTILGTAAYMSPEQARGQPVDKRSDIWAFGCVLYEMLTGRLAFPGSTVSDTIAAIISREPDWDVLPGSTPPGVRRLIARCLAKDPKRRVRDIGDVRLELDDTAGGVENRAVADDAARRRGLRWALALAGAMTAIAIAALAWALRAGRDDTVQPVTRATVTLPSDQRLDTSNTASALALSPDGRRLAYVAYTAGRARLHVRNLDAFVATPLGGTEGAQYPFFSPDGDWVAFFAQGKLKRVSLQGGAPVTICDAPVVGRGGTWAPDGTIVFDPGASGLMRVPAGGGRPDPVKSRDATMDSSDLSWPHFLPDGRVLLATVGVAFNSRMVALSLDTGDWRDLGEGLQAQYVPPGYLVFHAPAVREGEIHVVPFDATDLTVHGAPAPVLSGVFRANNSGGAYFAVSRNGSVIFARGGHARTLVRVERNGRRRPLTDDRRGFRVPKVSPDGSRIAITVDPRPSQIWVYDIALRSGIPLATEGHNLGPLWTPDGRHVLYTSNDDIYMRAADASTEAQPVLARDGPQYAASWLNDARSLIFGAGHPTTLSDIWLLPADSDPRPVIATGAREILPTLSPDGRWLAYTSDETGREEVYVRPFPNTDDAKWVVSRDGGVAPVWSPTGDELFYMSGRALMAVAITRAPAFRAALPERLFDGPFETGTPRFDVSPDGSYFVMVEADPDARPTQIHLVVNWIDELRRAAASRE